MESSLQNLPAGALAERLDRGRVTPMMSARKRRAGIYRLQCVARLRRIACEQEDRLWDRMPAVGREFGSPDFERLMQEDHQLQRGAFDPALRAALERR